MSRARRVTSAHVALIIVVLLLCAVAVVFFIYKIPVTPESKKTDSFTTFTHTGFPKSPAFKYYYNGFKLTVPSDWSIEPHYSTVLQKYGNKKPDMLILVFKKNLATGQISQSGGFGRECFYNGEPRSTKIIAEIQKDGYKWRISEEPNNATLHVCELLDGKYVDETIYGYIDYNDPAKDPETKKEFIDILKKLQLLPVPESI